MAGKYAVVGLSGDDILEGKLNRVMRTISDASMASIVAIKHPTKNEYPQAEVYFDASEDLGKYDTVLYINEVALAILQTNKVNLSIIRQDDAIPAQHGVLISVPFYHE